MKVFAIKTAVLAFVVVASIQPNQTASAAEVTSTPVVVATVSGSAGSLAE